MGSSSVFAASSAVFAGSSAFFSASVDCHLRPVYCLIAGELRKGVGANDEHADLCDCAVLDRDCATARC
jgi:hypothetical protein